MATTEGKTAETGPQLKDVPQGVSALMAKILDQLSLSAWLPALLLVSSTTVLLQLRTQQETASNPAAVKGSSTSRWRSPCSHCRWWCWPPW